MIAARALRRLRRDARGVTAVEFAVVSGPLFLILFGIMDMGRQAYASSVVQGTLVQAARKAGLEGANQATIKTFVDGQLSQFALPGNIQMTVTSFKQFSGVGNPEKITTDLPPLGTYNLGDCYIDSNNNGVYDTAQGTNGTGSAEDALRVNIKMTMNRLSPFGGLIGYGNTVTVDRTTFVQAEPYAGTVDPPTRCN